MVYHHRNVTCPNCGKIAERTRTVDSELLIGSPFRVCPHCGKSYYDSEYNEEGLVIFDNPTGEINIWAIVWLLISNIFLVVCIVNKIWEGFAVALILALIFDYLLIRLIWKKTHPEQTMQKTIDYLEGRGKERSASLVASMERLSNRMYLDALKSHGVNVPEYFYCRINEQEDKRDSELNTKQNSDDNQVKNPEGRTEIESDKTAEPNVLSFVKNTEEEMYLHNSKEPHIFFCKNCKAVFGGAKENMPEKCPKCGRESLLETTILKIDWPTFSPEKKKQLKEAFAEGKYNALGENNSVQVDNYSNADEIRKYKKLLDDGIITQEEFEAKKKQLLGL